MRKRWLIALFGLVGGQVAEAVTLEIRSATFVPGPITVTQTRQGVTSFGAQPAQTFPGCVTVGTRLFQGDSTNTGVFWPNASLQEFMTLLLEARRAQASVTVTYSVAASGRCYYRGITY